MTDDELALKVEAGARALQRAVCIAPFPRGRETDEEAWDRRWENTPEVVRDRYRTEALAVLQAAEEIEPRQMLEGQP